MLYETEGDRSRHSCIHHTDGSVLSSQLERLANTKKYTSYFILCKKYVMTNRTLKHVT